MKTPCTKNLCTKTLNMKAFCTKAFYIKAFYIKAFYIKAGLLLCLMFPLSSLHAADESLKDRIMSIMQHERRTDAEKARDANRKPAETLEFFRIREDMTVLELLPGGGWYTKILGPLLADKGKLHVAIGTNRVEAMIKGDPGFASTEVLPFDRSTMTRQPGSRRFSVPEFFLRGSQG